MSQDTTLPPLVTDGMLQAALKAAGFFDTPQSRKDMRAALEAAIAAQTHQTLDSIEQYRLQMAGISTAAIGYWKEGDGIHPDYDTVALRDVAKLYAKYDALYQAQQAQGVRHEPIATFQGRRLTPEGTFEFWGWLRGDPSNDPPVGALLYTAPPPSTSPCQFAIDGGGNLYRRYYKPVCDACVPAAKETDKWESSRVADFNAGWNACREAMLAAAPKAEHQPEREPAEWRKAVQEAYGWLWLINNEPMAPVPLLSEGKAAYKARKALRDLLTSAERGEAINAVREQAHGIGTKGGE